MKQNQNDDIVRASYIVSAKIAQYSKNCSDGEFVKECLHVVAYLKFYVQGKKKKKKDDFESISLSCRTVKRRIEELGAEIESSLMKQCLKFETFSLAIDESTDVIDVAQLAVFVRGVDSDFNVTEKIYYYADLGHLETL